MKKLFNIVFAVSLLGCSAMAQQKAQEPVAPSKYQPTEIEKLKLENLQQKAIIQQQTLNSLQMQKQVLETQIPQVQQQFNQAVEVLKAEGEVVRKSHNWQQVTFDPATLVYTTAPATPAAAVPAKPAPSAKP